MDIGVIPAVAWIRLIGVAHSKSSVVEQAKSLRWFAVVLMRFRKPVGKIEVTVVQTKGKGKRSEILVRENFLDFSAKCLIHPIVIIGVEESAVF